MKDNTFNLHNFIENIIFLFNPLALNKNILLNFSIGNNISLNSTFGSKELNLILNKLFINLIRFTENVEIKFEINNFKNNNSRYMFNFFIIFIDDYIKIELINSLFYELNMSTDIPMKSQSNNYFFTKYKKNNLINAIIKNEAESIDGITIITKICVDTLIQKKNEQNVINSNRIRILLVEDNKLNRNFIGYLLKKLNYNYEIATNGKEAVKLAEVNNFSLILMDCQLPIIDGYETTRIIRTSKKTNNKVPIVALTSDTSKKNKIKFFSAGMNDYIFKPININELQNKIESVIKKTSKNQVKHRKNMYENTVKLLTLELLLSLDNVKKLLSEYITMLLDFVKQLEIDYENSNYIQIAKIAHQIKGISCNLRLIQIQNVSLNIESMAKDNNEDLYKEFILLKELLEQLIDEKNKSNTFNKNIQ